MKSKSSTSDIRSTIENIADPFALLELWLNTTSENSKFDKFDQKVVNLDTKLDHKFAGVDSKHELILKSLYEIQDVAPLELGWANQLDQLISLRFSRTLEEAKEH